jgi:aspartate carbamoyltransferase catalytic subunit
MSEPSTTQSTQGAAPARGKEPAQGSLLVKGDRHTSPTQDELDLLQYAPRIERPVRMKIPELQRDERLRHVIFSGQFSQEMLEQLERTADQIRVLSRNRTGQDFLIHQLSHKRAMLYFTQPSTRTFLSFMAACQILGITCNEVRDPTTSSETKGETRFDSIRMFSSYFDVIIMRSTLARLAETCAYLMTDLEDSGNRSVPIINAGSGADEHPTQALLDIYTLQRSFQFADPRDCSISIRFNRLQDKYGGLTKGLPGKTYGFCGDIGRGRTVRSLATLLSRYPQVSLIFIAPNHPTLALGDDLRQRLFRSGVKVHEVDSLEEPIDGVPVIEQLDALYMTRIQKEHNVASDDASFAQIDFSRYKLSRELVSRMKEYAPILHPFPRDQHFGEIPPEIDDDPRAMYFRQARNGMWIRAALLATIFSVDRSISQFFHEEFSEWHHYNEEEIGAIPRDAGN